MAVFVDADTYREISSSEFLRNEFAAYEHRTTVRENDSYTGVYFYGTNTYLEFFDADADTADQVGDCGIGLGSDYVNGIITLRTLLSENYSLVIDSVSRQLDTKLVPWFTVIAFEHPFVEDDYVIGIWIMEYFPEFLERWHPQRDSQTSGITRKEVLDRYKSVLDGQIEEPIMSDIIGITIAADSVEIDGLTALFTTIGFKVRSSGREIRCSDGDFSFNLVPENEKTRGLTEIRIRTKKNLVRSTQVNFGQNSALTFPSDTMAIWSFHH